METSKVRDPKEFMEASQLRWKPGQWPKHCELGAICNAERGFDGELMFVDYENEATEIITRVFND